MNKKRPIEFYQKKGFKESDKYLYRVHHKKELDNLKRYGLTGTTPQEAYDKILTEHPEYKKEWDEVGINREESTWGADDQETQGRRLYFVKTSKIPYKGDLVLRVDRDIADKYAGDLIEDAGLPKEYFYDVSSAIPSEHIMVKQGRKYVPVREVKGTWATQFMKEYEHKYNHSLIDERDRIIEDAKVSLGDISPKGKVVKLYTLISMVQGEGSGSKAIDKLTDMAERTGTYIILKPGKVEGVMNPMLNVDQLYDWYKRHGFVKGKNGWLIYKPKHPNKVVDPSKYMVQGFWSRKKVVRSKPKIGRVR